MHNLDVSLVFLFLFIRSGFFNGAGFFDSTSSGSIAAGALFMIMGGAWFFAAPMAVVILIVVSTSSFLFVVCLSYWFLVLPAGAQILPCLWQDSEPSC